MPPTMLIQSLESVRRRVRWLSVAFGVGVLLATAVGALLATVLVDYFLNLSPVPRLLVIGAAVAAVVYVLFRWVVQPLWSRLTLSDVAGRIEQVFPQFDDRLRSTVNFMRADVPGSEVMKDRVVTQASELARSLDLHRAIVMAPVWYSLAAGLGAIVLAVLLSVAVSDRYVNIAVTRLLHPFGDAAWPKRVQIEMLVNVPQRVPVGQRVELKLNARGARAGTKATVIYRYNAGPWQRELMNRAADGTFATSLDARVEPGKQQGTLQVRVIAGDDLKDLPEITILPRLTVSSVKAVVTPPKYVGSAAATQPTVIDLSSSSAVMAAGSQVRLKIAFNKPLAPDLPVKIIPVSEEMKLPPMNWSPDGAAGAAASWVANESLRFHVKATDTDGFTTTGIEEYELIVRPDQTPTVQIENPRRNEERTAVAVVPLQAVAEDDYGIESMKLVIDRLGDRKHWEIDLVAKGAPLSGVQWARIDGTVDRARFRSTYSWDLAASLKDAKLNPGDVLEYYLLAKDNFALEGKFHEPVPSGKLRINIISQEQLTDAITNDLRQVATSLTEIKNGQTRTKEETSALAQETEKKDALDEADRAAGERLAGQQGTAAAQTKQVTLKLDAVRQRLSENKSPNKELDDLARDVRDLTNRTAEQPMKDAASTLGSINQQPGRNQRNQALSSAVANQQEATDQLQRAIDRMGSIGSLQQTIDRFRDILNAQKQLSKDTREVGNSNLGKTPAQMKPEDRDKLEKIASDQNSLAARTQKAIEDMNRTAGQMTKADPAASEAMKNAAKTASSQQVAPNQQKAAASAKQNQQSSAQSAQKQAELGLEMVINQLREAERRKLEELSKKLEDLQKQIANLIRRQAGHNVDDLALQGPDRLKQLDAQQLADLLAKAQRVKDALPPVPAPPQLTTAQEQTERNTRDIARTADEIPNGAEPSAALTRAASRMERAIVSLRQKQLDEAYAPPQVEALAALEEAARIVDEQKQQVDQKRQDQQKESVRQAYIRIKEAQEKVNGQTAQIDKARGADGNLKRDELIRLGQLPGQQGKLSEDVSNLDEALAAVGSIVYVWANKDIAESMSGVKDELGKQSTGAVTQAEQTRIVEQLDAMIRNLAIKPPERKFEQRNSGGGGGNGQCSPGLPSEAELRLLKELQQAINKSTKTIDAQPDARKKDAEPTLVALGTRQGELRTLLDEMMKKNSNGQVKLGPEPDPKDQLPEEVGKEQVENQELDDDLLNQKPADEKVAQGMNLVGDRMARSRQRLAINHDPGKTTQLIQERILIDLEKLADEARKQQAQASAQSKPGQQGQKPQPKPGEQAQAANQGQKPGAPKPRPGANPAQQSSLTPGNENQADLSQQIKESEREWGQISPRARDAAIEGANEEIIGKYRKLVEDYYRGVSIRSTERQ